MHIHRKIIYKNKMIKEISKRNSQRTVRLVRLVRLEVELCGRALEGPVPALVPKLKHIKYGEENEFSSKERGSWSPATCLQSQPSHLRSLWHCSSSNQELGSGGHFAADSPYSRITWARGLLFLNFSTKAPLQFCQKGLFIEQQAVTLLTSSSPHFCL